MASRSPSPDAGGMALFTEPADFRPPSPPPSFVTHTLPRSSESISLRLVGHNPLWGHHLWNGGRVVSDYLEEHADTLVRGRTVLELGAGAGLPSVTAALLGATAVVVTDYPDADLVQNLQMNVDATLAKLHTGSEGDGGSGVDFYAAGYVWGASAVPLLEHLPGGTASGGFDVLILADLLFNHSEHEKLVGSMRACLKRSESAVALVFFTPYRPWLLEKDLAFFEIAAARGFVVEKLMERMMDKVMFDKDPGDEAMRRTVHCYSLRWTEDSLKEN